MIATLFRLLTLRGSRRRPKDLGDLSHLSPHLLRDIGLHAEDGRVRLLEPAASHRPAMADPVGKPPRLARGRGCEYCPHCGMSLT